MLSKKKKIFILVGMVALLVVTGYVNVLLNNSAQANKKGSEEVQAGNFFTTYRADRQTTRNQTMLYLEGIIASEASSAEAKAEAEAQQLALTATMTLENALEGLIMSKGFEDCVVSASTQNVNVIIKQAELTEEEVAQILSIVVNESGRSAKNVKIIPIE